MTDRIVPAANSSRRRSFRATIWHLVPVVCAIVAGPASAQQESAPKAPAIFGAVKDPSGATIAGAVVTLQAAGSTEQRTTITDQAGAFHFSPVSAGTYKITITASGFAVWTAENVAPGSGESPAGISAVLPVAPAATEVTVTLPPHELAAEQVKAEEKQRVLGIFPNFFVAYQPNSAPLTAAQKFQLGWKTIFDPVPILFSAAGAGIQQARNSYAGYGQGMEGYWKRFGANYADRVDETLIGNVVMQSVFHQDPRYFYRGKGSFGSRALYAIATAFVAKGDNGHWQPAYADVLGGMASYGISTLYRPGTSRPGLRLSHVILLGFAGRAGHNLFEEFVLPKLTTHFPQAAISRSQLILRAGTPVPLISVRNLSAKAADKAEPIGFVLASDIRVGRVVVAKAGSQAWGRLDYRVESGTAGGLHIDLDHVLLRVGKVEVPLRSTQVRNGGSTVEYHRLENSGRIAIMLYADKDTVLEPAQ